MIFQIKIIDPEGNAIVTREKKNNGFFEFTAKKMGEYYIKFNNKEVVNI